MQKTLKQQIIDLLDGHRIMTIATNRTDGWPQAVRSCAASARARSSALQRPSPTMTSEPTIERTWVCRNERAAANT